MYRTLNESKEKQGNKMTIIELEDSIKKNRFLYWDGCEDCVSDEQYDVLIEELRGIDPENILLTQPEYIPQDRDTIKHNNPMLSLDKIYSLEELLVWCSKVSRDINEKFEISPKYDGIAACYYIERGILATRGDGHKGENITDKIPLINFETNINNIESGVVGEVLIKNSDFKSCILTRKDGQKFKNPRNLVAGVTNPARKDMDEIKDKVQLTFIQHNNQTKICNSDEIRDSWDLIVDSFREIDYPIDGIVIKLQDIQYGKTLGETSHHPRHSIAFKFPDESKWATVTKIDWQVGKRKITPVCYIEPTFLDGVTIRKITLHNAKKVLDMDLHEGDDVNIVRRGGVNPYIEESRPGTGKRNRIVIELCPSCGKNVLYSEPELICENKDCDGSVKKKLLATAKVLEIEELGDQTISKIVDYSEGEVTNVFDLLQLDYEYFIKLDGFADRSAKKLSDNIKKIRAGVEDWKILVSLNLEGIGKTLSKQLLGRVNLKELMNITSAELYDFDNMGQERITVLLEGLNNHSYTLDKLINDNIRIIETKIYRKIEQKTKLICFSGTFQKPKQFYQQLARDKNMTVVDTVTRKLDYLITAGPSSSKTNKARSYGIPILNIDDFEKL